MTNKNTGKGPGKGQVSKPESISGPIKPNPNSEGDDELTGAYEVIAADASGNAPYSLDANGRAIGDISPSEDRAVNMFLGVRSEVEQPPADQLELSEAIGEVLHTIRKLYIQPNGEVSPKFRLNYIRLFELAKLGLSGNAMPEVAKAALERLIDDLISEEGPKRKNLYLKNLASAAAKLCLLFAAFYIIFAFEDGDFWEKDLKVNVVYARSFMALWVGTFIGVCLSYALRKSEFKLRDLTVTEADFLEPTTRLLFAGTLAAVLGYIIMIGFVEIKIGSIALKEFVTKPTLAVIFGIVLGINDTLLPQSIVQKTNTIWSKIK